MWVVLNGGEYHLVGGDEGEFIAELVNKKKWPTSVGSNLRVAKFFG